jgi:SAM-dependent methyltransferase
MKIHAILATYLPTPPEVVSAMLDMAEVSERDVVLDIGCGDGRICIAAARDYGAHAVGVDLEPYWVEQSQANAAAAGVAELTSFHAADACSWDVSDATVIALYLVHWSTQFVARELLPRARPGTRVVSHNFPIDGIQPVKEQTVIDSDGGSHNVFLWVIGADSNPVKKAGRPTSS